MLQSLTLVRHGESMWNAAHIIQGHLDSDLSETGCAQARSLARKLNVSDYDVVYSSNLRRALQTAELATGLSGDQILQHIDLREQSFGHWEGKKPDDVAREFPEEWKAYRSDPLRFRPPGAEGILKFSERTDRMLRLLHSECAGKNVIAFTHGGFVRMAVIRIFDLPTNPWGVLRVANTSLTRIEFPNGSPVLAYYGITGHLAQSRVELSGDERDETGK